MNFPCQIWIICEFWNIYGKVGFFLKMAMEHPQDRIFLIRRRWVLTGTLVLRTDSDVWQFPNHGSWPSARLSCQMPSSVQRHAVHPAGWWWSDDHELLATKANLGPSLIPLLKCNNSNLDSVFCSNIFTTGSDHHNQSCGPGWGPNSNNMALANPDTCPREVKKSVL